MKKEQKEKIIEFLSITNKNHLIISNVNFWVLLIGLGYAIFWDTFLLLWSIGLYFLVSSVLFCLKWKD